MNANTVLLLLLVVASATPPACQARVLNFFQISDLHLEQRYSVNESAGHFCTPLPTPDAVAAAQPNFYTADRPPLGPLGDYFCDSPEALIKSALRQMRRVNATPDFILWTGDSSPHRDAPKPSWDYVMASLKNITGWLRQHFPDESVPIVPALGNHDAFPPDQFVDGDQDPGAEAFYSRYIEEGSLGDLIPVASRAQFKHCGFYNFSYALNDTASVRFVALNTNLYYSDEQPLAGDDPCGQLAWLEQQLETTPANEQIFLLAHVPPGFYEHNTTVLHFNIPNGEAINRRYVELVSNRKHARKIAAHFYGHTHTDSFKLFFGHQRSVGVAFIAPSITPLLWLNHGKYGVNPSFRLYQYDTDRKVMLDYRQYFLDLKLQQQQRPDGGSGRADNAKRLNLDEPQRVNTRRQKRGVGAVAAVNAAAAAAAASTTEPTLPPPAATTVAEPAATEKAPATATDSPDAAAGATESGPGEDVTEPAATTTTAPESEAATTTNPPKEAADRQGQEPSKPAADDDADASLWRLSYKATNAFNVSDLSIKNMHRAYIDMVYSPEKNRFQLYFKHNTVNHMEPANRSCDLACHNQLMCAIARLEPDEMRHCIKDGDHDADVDGDVDAVTTPTPATTLAPPGVVDAQDQTAAVPEKTAEPEEEDHSLRGFVIGFSVVLCLAIAVFGLFMYRRIQRNRHVAQEFLLTDSVFRYDGYSQVDEVLS